MARTNNLTNFLTDVATAIKTKKGSETAIPAANFDTEIANLPTGVKQFATVQAMQNDSNKQEGDLAVVYGTSITSVTENSVFSSCTFPNTVVLSSAFSDNIYGQFRSTGSGWFDGMVEMSSSSFRFDGWGEEGQVMVEYSSQDGITYTRTDGGEELQEFGTTIQWEDGGDPFPSVIGNFMKIISVTFEGLYEAQTVTGPGDTPTLQYVLADTQLTATTEDVFDKIFYGKNGIETGVLQTTTELTEEQLKKRITIWNTYNNATFGLNSSVTRLGGLFEYMSTLTTIPMIDTSNVIDMQRMFTGCTNLVSIPLLDTSSVTNMEYMFGECTSLTTIPLLDTSSATNMSQVFYGCTGLTTVPLLDTSSATNISYMFFSCRNLVSVPLLDTSSATNMDQMFANCKSLTTVPLLDTSSATNMSSMFTGCNNLVSVPLLNTSSATNIGNMFYGCTSLTTIPSLNTSSATNMSTMFRGCTNLTTVPLLNTSSVRNMNNMFRDCTSLDNTSLNNILAMCASATSYTGTKTLAYIGLTSTQATTCQGLSNYGAFTTAGWTTGY